MDLSWLYQFVHGHHDFSVQFVGAFAGAFFAFLFFLTGDWVKRKIKRTKDIKNEHAALERYFGTVHQILSQNKRIAEQLVKDFATKKINVSDFVEIPVREDTTMKFSDLIFINKMEFFNADLRSMNRQLNDIGKVKERINEDLLKDDPKTKSRAEDSLGEFSQGISMAVVGLSFLIDENKERFIENQVILKRYKNWKFKTKRFEQAVEKRKLQIEKEKEIVERDKESNFIFQDRLKKLKKFGIPTGEHVD